MLFSKLKLNYFYLTLAVTALLVFPCPAFTIEHSKVIDDNTFIIFSLNSSISPLSKSKARMLYKGKVRRLDKLKITLLDLSSKSPYKAPFYKLLLGKSLSQLNGYRASLAFSGKGNIPKSIEHDNLDSILLWLEKHPNGIAYTPKMNLPSNVNILFELK